MNTEVSFASAIATFFGKKDGQSLLDFKKEIDALTPTDREEITQLLKAKGFNIVSR